MRREPYVRPVTKAREPAPRWVRVWGTRIVVLLLLGVVALVSAVLLFRVLGGGDPPTFEGRSADRGGAQGDAATCPARGCPPGS